MTFDLRRIRKEQVHSTQLKTWNYRGTTDFSEFPDISDETPFDALAGDNWVSAAPGIVTVNDVEIWPGDMVLAMEDDPGYLTKANIALNKWKINRNTGTRGGVCVAENEFFVNTKPDDPDYNYNLSTKFLTIKMLPADFFKTGDNVNMYVNGNKYTYRHFVYKSNSNMLWWKKNNAGFDLEHGDFIEIEVFRN